MRALDRKLIRDLIQMRDQALAIGLVMACGVATFVLALSTVRSLELTEAAYYEHYRFADVFTHLKRAPKSLADRIAAIPGVARVQGRIVVDVTLDVPGLAEPAVGRLISIPERTRPTLNGLYLRSGRSIEPGRRGEVLISESFATAHGLGPGGRVRAVLNGKRQVLEIVGVALSPEYVYEIREDQFFPDEKRFGVFWMGEPGLADAFDLEGAFNDVALTLTRGASEAEVLRRLDGLTAPYGGLGAYGRDDQVSNKLVSSELRGLHGVGLAVPVIFLAVAAFLLNIVVSRLVAVQREQIATLKAFGYTDREVSVHYLELIAVIVVLGVTLGAAVGGWFGLSLTRLYARYFHFPVMEYRFEPGVVVQALAIGAAAALVGTLGAVWRAVRLAPAVAMRPEPPASYRPTIVERCLPRAWITPAVRMILRRIGRQPVRATLSVVGVALAAAVLVVGNFSADALDHLVEVQFHQLQCQDVSVAFVEPASARAAADIRHLAGVVTCELFRSVSVRLRSGHRSRRTAIMGLEPDGLLYRPRDAAGRLAPLPEHGLMLSAKLAELLAVVPGDPVVVEVLEGARPVRQVPVASLVVDYEGTSAYMARPALNRLLREGGSISGAFLSVDARGADALYARLESAPRVASVTVKEAMVSSFRKIIAESLLAMQSIIVIFAAIIAFGVVYNGAQIALAERSRELATLRVIGFTRAEVSAILLGELAILTLVGLPIGLALGTGFAGLTTRFYDTDLFRIPLVIYPSTYALAALVTIVAAIASGWIVRRRVDALDLIVVLKTKE